MKSLRIYTDTSVFGGVFDPDFSKPSTLFFEQVHKGIFTLVTSVIVKKEIEPAPEKVRRLFNGILDKAEIIEVTDQSLSLRQAYLEAKIVTPKSSNDALHVALATTSCCAFIVSWNFKHIVHFDKISLYNKTNKAKGFGPIAIFSPWEVINYENKNL